MNVASIIIPCRNHAEYLPAAIESALAQTVTCEVTVIDDGSTDDTRGVIENYIDTGVRAICFSASHGVAAARNRGIEYADAEYLMFLDADDTIEPAKVEKQIAMLEANPDAGFCLCDTRIIDEVRGEKTKANRRYLYENMKLDGNISWYLADRNFIPVHAPLIWRPALGDIRFPDGPLEDWAFWRALAAVASCTYLPEVLCTYNARKTGRNRKSRAA